MQVDFYQLSRDPAETALALLAAKTLDAGQRLLVVADDANLRERIGLALWERREAFLANGEAGGAHDARQPILLSGQVEPANQARFAAFADGRWRDEGLAFDRVFLLFDGATIDDARATWRDLSARDGVECRYWKQDGGRWVQAG
ncbi:DNA polymerase III chi subunit [Novosphingobium kunmingense]|uniref:DNA polymerase III chi subunit n=1 Tax=Novosphingobium kunmingense TaxID=1211806 RepID=A0A2N0I0Z9_9SPHN|nr:DNA polymerase III subunit chi [Novosphingobium kunmingense]PKB24860.1 DNA polymerase III chi subunit [Novosphingobium kunmingense]